MLEFIGCYLTLGDVHRHIKKDKKYYIENLTCFVTRVKTVTNFEHLRHGMPEVQQVSIAPEQHRKGLVAASKDRTAGILPSPERSVKAPAAPPIPPQVQPPLPPQFSPGTPTSIVMSGVRPGDFYYDDSLTFESTNYMSSNFVYGPELMGLAYENQMGMGFEGALNFQEINAVRRWLTEPSPRVDPHFADPRFACGNPNLGENPNFYVSKNWPPVTTCIVPRFVAMTNLTHANGWCRSLCRWTHDASAPSADRSLHRSSSS
jgi:hypothetical protein